MLQRKGEEETGEGGESVLVNRRAQPAGADIVFARNQGEADAGVDDGLVGGDAAGGIIRREQGAEEAVPDPLLLP